MEKKEDHDHDKKFNGFSLEELDEQFSSLAQELKGGGVPLNSVMEVNERMEESIPYFRDYNPTVMDFLARARTHEECEEIIAYCLKQKEISETEAEKLRTKLTKGGPKAFGTREAGYYDSKL